jgi:hypothetical protein
MRYSEEVSPPMPHELSYLMDVFQAWLGHYSRHGMNKVVLAANAYLIFDHIHPFDDCNGRTSRMLLTFILLHAGVFPPMFRLDDDYDVVIWAQDLAFKGNVDPFLEALIEGCQLSIRDWKQGPPSPWNSHPSTESPP